MSDLLNQFLSERYYAPCKYGYPLGPNQCQCYQTYTGKYCTKSHAPAQINATDSQVTLASHWLQKYVGTYCTPAAYELNYLSTTGPHSSLVLSPKSWTENSPDGSGVPLPTEPISKGLYLNLLHLHETVGNANAKNKFIVIADGCTQIVTALIYAVMKKRGKISVSAPAPHWPKFKTIPSFVPNCTFETTDQPSDLSFITLPNNPDGSMELDPLMLQAKTVAYDLVYYWPSYLWQQPCLKRDDEIMLFSLSKFAAASATRFGWALVKDEELAQNMAEYIKGTQLDLSVDIQHRALHIISHINRYLGQKEDLLSYLAKELQLRWLVLLKLFELKKDWQVATTEPAGFIIWIKAKTNNVDAYQAFKKIGVTGEPGTVFGATAAYVRLNIGMEQPVFMKMMQRLNLLI
ncbi:MAG: hypothetical protein RLZ12_998 [Bacillota bacterium]|jgi:hypothetical protein